MNRFLAYFINTFYICYSYFTYFLFAVILMEMGMGGGRAGVLLMVYTATALAASFAIGLLEDRFGARGNTVCGLLLMCAFYLGLLRCRSFPLLIALFFLGGLGNNLVRVTMNALFFKTHDSARQGREIGLYNFLGQFAMGCGVIAGSLLAARMEFRFLLIASAALSLVLICFAAVLRPVAVRVEPLSRYLADIATRRVLLFVVALALFCLHWGAEITCYAPFLRETLGLGTAAAGAFMGLPIIFLAFCSYYFGWRRDRGESSIRLAVTAIALSGAGLILFSAVRSPSLSFFFRLVHESGDAAFTVFAYVGIAHLFPRERLGGTSGSMYVVMVGAQAAGAWLFGWMGSSWGYTLPYLVAGACALATIPLILCAHRYYLFAAPVPPRA
ncbi:MAG: MFS transporter [bacterium]|nr:MFS transporter [bacterium]